MTLLLGKPDQKSSLGAPEYFFGIIVGKRRSGKTTLLIRLLHTEWRGMFDRIYICGSTVKYQSLYTDLADQDAGIVLMTDYIGILQTIRRELARIRSLTSRGMRPLFVFDDCAFDREFAKHPCLKILASAGRHYRLSTVILAQKMKSMPPDLRVNIDFCYAFRCVNTDEQRAIYECCGQGKFPDFAALISRNRLLFMQDDIQRVVQE